MQGPCERDGIERGGEGEGGVGDRRAAREGQWGKKELKRGSFKQEGLGKGKSRAVAETNICINRTLAKREVQTGQSVNEKTD